MKDPAFPFYAGDFLTGVMHLTMEERGIYITLLAYQWAHGQVPKKRLGLIVGLSWDKLPDEVREKFKDCGDSIENSRLFEEKKKRAAFKEKQRLNGKKGGRPKNPDKTQSTTQTQTQKKPLEDESEKESEKEVEKESENVKSASVEIWPTFDNFWIAYDYKIGKEAAVKAWKKINQADREELMGVVGDYVSNTNKDGTYPTRKHPSTYLNNKSWRDEIVRKQSGKSSTSAYRDLAQRASAALRSGSIIPDGSEVV